MDLRQLVCVLLLASVGFGDDQDFDGDTELSAHTPENTTLTSKILKMNVGSYHLLEGDVELPQNRNAKKCLRGSKCHWPKSNDGMVRIPFTLSDKYNSRDKQIILDAMEQFHRQTCIRFIRRLKQTAYLNIKPSFGCSSMLGYIGDRLEVSLQRVGCLEKGIIQHELMHALGFYHEHTRSDRDKYVKINWDNIHEFYTSDFKKRDTNNQNTPYDYNSIMHYDRTAFGKAGSETITPIPNPNVSIGQNGVLSKIDILRVNRLYRC